VVVGIMSVVNHKVFATSFSKVTTNADIAIAIFAKEDSHSLSMDYFFFSMQQLKSSKACSTYSLGLLHALYSIF